MSHPFRGHQQHCAQTQYGQEFHTGNYYKKESDGEVKFVIPNRLLVRMLRQHKLVDAVYSSLHETSHSFNSYIVVNVPRRNVAFVMTTRDSGKKSKFILYRDITKEVINLDLTKAKGLFVVKITADIASRTLNFLPNEILDQKTIVNLSTESTTVNTRLYIDSNIEVWFGTTHVYVYAGRQDNYMDHIYRNLSGKILKEIKNRCTPMPPEDIDSLGSMFYGSSFGKMPFECSGAHMSDHIFISDGKVVVSAPSMEKYDDIYIPIETLPFIQTMNPEKCGFSITKDHIILANETDIVVIDRLKLSNNIIKEKLSKYQTFNEQKTDAIISESAVLFDDAAKTIKSLTKIMSRGIHQSSFIDSVNVVYLSTSKFFCIADDDSIATRLVPASFLTIALDHRDDKLRKSTIHGGSLVKAIATLNHFDATDKQLLVVSTDSRFMFILADKGKTRKEILRHSMMYPVVTITRGK